MMELAVGFLIAFAVGLTGVGGGMLTTPILILVFGLAPATSVGTALLYAAIVRIPALAVFLSRRQVDFRTLWGMLAAGVPMAVAGALLLSHYAGIAAKLVPPLIGVAVVLAGGLSLFRFRRTVGARPRPVRLMIWALPIGLQTGICSSGAGALGLVSVLRFSGLDPVRAIGTNLLFGIALAFAAGGVHAVAGNWNGPVLASLTAGGLIGAPLGAVCAPLLPAGRLRAGLLVWVMVLGGGLICKGVLP